MQYRKSKKAENFEDHIGCGATNKGSTVSEDQRTSETVKQIPNERENQRNREPAQFLCTSATPSGPFASIGFPSQCHFRVELSSLNKRILWSARSSHVSLFRPSKLAIAFFAKEQ
jgi:hypothetical protein